MNLEIHLEIKPADICISEIIVLSLLQNKNFKEIKAIHRYTCTNMVEIIEGLERKGYVKLLGMFVDIDEGEFYPEVVSLREKALDLIEDRNVNLTQLINDYRALFPQQFKGDLNGCKLKMKSFMIKNKKYTPEIILRATAEYNKIITNTNGYRRQAHYFIIKDGISDLARYCEMIVNGEVINKTIGDNSIRI